MSTKAGPVRVVVVGCGNMGSSHARAYTRVEGFALAGLVDHTEAKARRLGEALGGVAVYPDLAAALAGERPDAVAVCTHPGSHAALVLEALAAGCHVFAEKPLATTVEEAEAVVAEAERRGLKVVVGYILRVHPAWARFIGEARELGKPLVMRMNLNQQSKGPEWEVHKKLMAAVSPIVDCGVHYVDVMCQMTRSRPVRVQAMGARLTEEVGPGMYNYGQLQVFFADGSVGWYEAGWGPMMSETAYFVKDVIGPKGCVSLAEQGSGDSATIDAHTKTSRLLRHDAASGENRVIDMRDEPDHQELCDREQEFFGRAIRDEVDLREHLEDAVNSLRIVLAADASVRTGQPVRLS